MRLFGIVLISCVAMVLCSPAVFAEDSAGSPPGDVGGAKLERSEPLALSFDDGFDQEPGTSVTRSVTETSTAEPEPILWKGFLYGDQHFRDKPRPVGSPLYFEDPFINSDLRFIYLWHEIPEQSQLRGGDLNVWALQARIAITDRLQFIATGNNVSHLTGPIINDDTGYNDMAIGLKYAVLVDHDNDFILSTGLRWKLSNGHAGVLQGNVDELSPFITAYKGWGKWNFIADVAGRIAMDEHQGNHLLSWNAHVDYEVCKYFFPMFELHGVHYLSNGDRLPLDIGGLDYANIGSAHVAGHAAFWGGVGFRVPIAEHISWGAVWEFPMQTTSNNDIFEQRVTTNVILTF